MKNGDTVRLKKDTAFYKRDTKAVIINTCGDSKKFEIRYENERYESGDVDIMPKELFECIEQ